MPKINTYLTFDGNAREAMTFYAKALGGDLRVVTFGEVPGECPEGAKDKVMHAAVTKGDAMIMASDTVPGMPYQHGNNFSIALGCSTAEETDSLFNAFNENATVTMPPQETFWATRFGMLTDQFGINWMFNCDKPQQV